MAPKDRRAPGVVVPRPRLPVVKTAWLPLRVKGLAPVAPVTP